MHRQVLHCVRSVKGKDKVGSSCLVGVWLFLHDKNLRWERKLFDSRHLVLSQPFSPFSAPVSVSAPALPPGPLSNTSDSCLLVGEVPRTDRAAELINEMHCCTAGALAGLLLHHDTHAANPVASQRSTAVKDNKPVFAESLLQDAWQPFL